MKQLQIRPVIYEFENFGEFAKEFQLTEADLILTNEYIYNPLISKYGVPCQTIFQEKYGGGEPSDTMVDGILAEMNSKPCNRIIAVGGGTVIDIAKVLSVSDNTEHVDSLYDDMAGLKQNHELFIVPTTCGTGSEVTNIAIVNRTRLGTKQGLVAPALFASAAVLIPEFITTLPYGVFATSSIDALIHAVESFLNPISTPYTELFAKAAMAEILGGYQEVAQDKNAAVRLGAKFLRAANYAGIAFATAGCGAVHAMSYALGGKYHVAHGESNYQFFLPVLDYYKKKAPEGKIQALEEILKGLLGTDDGIEGLRELLEKILPRKAMHEYGAVQEDIMPFAQSTVDSQQRLLAGSYVPLTLEEIRDLFQGCL